MIAGRRGYYPAGTLRFRQGKYFVQGAAGLERSCVLKVFQLEEDLTSAERAESGRVFEDGFADMGSDALIGIKDFPDDIHVSLVR